MNFLKWLIDILFGWTVNPRNPYMKVLKDQYLWLIVAPIVIVGGTFYYFYTNGIAFTSEYESLRVFPIFGIPLFIGIQTLVMLTKAVRKQFPEAFGILVQLSIVISISAGYFHYFIPESFTQKIENFQKEKKYYLRHIEIRGSEARDGKGQLLGFDLTGSDGNYSCQIYYDESDTLLDPVNDHRGLSFSGTLGHEKTGDIPIKLTKIEPKFYYVCRDFDHIKKIKD